MSVFGNCDENNTLTFNSNNISILSKCNIEMESTGEIVTLDTLKETITSVIIPDEIVEISDEVFLDFKIIETIKINHTSRLHTIGKKAFMNCVNLETNGEKNESIKLPNSLVFIEELAFAHSGLKSIEFYDDTNSNLTSIRKQAFSACSELEKIVIPSKVSLIEEKAFEYCSNLKNVEIKKNTNQITLKKNIFIHCDNLIECSFLGGKLSDINKDVFTDVKLLNLKITLNQIKYNANEYKSEMDSTARGGAMNKKHYSNKRKQSIKNKKMKSTKKPKRKKSTKRKKSKSTKRKKTKKSTKKK